MAYYNRIHQDLPSPDTSSHLSNRVNPRISAHGLSPLPAPVPLPTYLPPTCPSSPISRTTAKTSSVARARFLLWYRRYRRRLDWYLDEMDARSGERSMVVGDFLDVGGEEEMESGGVDRLLGVIGEFECGRVE